MRTQVGILFSLGSLALLLSSCGDDTVGASADNSGSAIKSTALAGTYTLDSWLVSAGDCESQGAALPQSTDSLVVVKLDQSWGTILKTMSCGSSEVCDSLTAGTRQFYLWGQQFTTGSDAAGFAGTTVLAGEVFGQDICEGSIEVNSLKVGNGNTLTIEVRTTDAGNFAKDSEGFCMTDAANAAAQGKPCTKKDVIILKPVS